MNEAQARKKTVDRTTIKKQKWLMTCLNKDHKKVKQLSTIMLHGSENTVKIQ